MTYNNELMKKVWKEEQDILDVIHKICVDNNLKYSLAYGTLLGAVRHGGFIPWDDDLDICMPREDYEKLISLWKDTDKYLLQNHNTNLNFAQSFTKIRKKVQLLSRKVILVRIITMEFLLIFFLLTKFLTMQ